MAPAASKQVCVLRSFKGPAAAGETISVDAATVPAACGIPFVVGEGYLLVAYRDEAGSLRTGTCSGTRPLDRAGPELAILEGEAGG